MPFQAILFDPVTRDSSAVSVRAFGSALEITGGRETLRVDPARCELTAAGWDHASIQITWMGEGGTFALSSNDQGVKAELARLTKFGAALKSASRTQSRTKTGGRVGMMVVAFATLLPALLLLGLIVFRNQIIDAVLARIPTSVDREIGRMFEGETVGSKDTVSENEATRAVQQIVNRLKDANPDKRFDFKVTVLRNKDVNAFAAPGGSLVVYTGLLAEAGSAEEVAGVLAHEMAHATRRHSVRQLIYGAGLIPLMGMAIGHPDASDLFKNASQLSELRFSRAQEEDADQTGFDTLVAAGIRTDGMARFFDRLARNEGPTPSFISTHPSSGDRAAAIRQRTESLASSVKPQPLDIDWKGVQSSIR
ncbi:MAG: M48 family metallopeptidase [Vicinamibacteria bacterium]